MNSEYFFRPPAQVLKAAAFTPSVGESIRYRITYDYPRISTLYDSYNLRTSIFFSAIYKRRYVGTGVVIVQLPIRKVESLGCTRKTI